MNYHPPEFQVVLSKIFVVLIPILFFAGSPEGLSSICAWLFLMYDVLTVVSTAARYMVIICA